MGILKIIPFEQAQTSGSGITIALCDGKSGQHVRIGISEKAQELYFGGSLSPDKDAIVLNISDDPGKTHLMRLYLADSGAPDSVPLFGSARGSVALKLMPWCQVPNGKIPARSMNVTHAPKTGEVVVKMPEWSRPPERKIGQGRPLMD